MTPTMENRIPVGQSALEKSSLIGSLLNFNQFITTRLVKIIFIAGLVLIPLATIGSSAAMFLFLLFKGGGSNAIIPGFFQIIVSIIASLLGILLLRIYCEFTIVIFKINENLQAIRNRGAQL